MKKIFLILLLSTVFISCNKLSISQLEDEVRDSMVAEYRVDGIYVGEVDLEHIEGDRYTGVVELRYDGGTYEHVVDVVYNGDMFVWEVYD